MQTLRVAAVLLFTGGIVSLVAGQSANQIILVPPTASVSIIESNLTTSQATNAPTTATLPSSTTIAPSSTVSSTNASASSATSVSSTTVLAPSSSTSATRTIATTAANTPSTTTVRVPVVLAARANVPTGSAQPSQQVQGANSGVVYPPIVDSPQPPPQPQNVWVALNYLRAKGQSLISDEISVILQSAVAGTDYPIYNTIPDTSFGCQQVKQAGFYADPGAACQVFRRCDINGNLWSFLCPNQTLFNQITLVCDWFFNVDCSKSASFYDYSNSRLYHSNWRLLDDK